MEQFVHKNDIWGFAGNSLVTADKQMYLHKIITSERLFIVGVIVQTRKLFFIVLISVIMLIYKYHISVVIN